MVTDSFVASLEEIIDSNHPEMKELERKIYAKELAKNINKMIEEAYAQKGKNE